MGLISKFMALIPLLLLLVSNAIVDATSGVFDITTFGAKPNADATQALADAWKEACASATPSKVLVPKGTYQLGESRLKGPCKSPIELLVEGTLQASPTDTEGDGLLVMEYVDHLTLSSTRVFDGQGKGGWVKNDCHLKKEKVVGKRMIATWLEKNDCHPKKICKKLPMINVILV